MSRTNEGLYELFAATQPTMNEALFPTLERLRQKLAEGQLKADPAPDVEPDETEEPSDE